MLSAAQTHKAFKPTYAYGIIAVFLLGFYIGALFFVGAFAATVVSMTYFRGKFKWMVGFGGGFFGLATWFSVLLNHREQYDRLVAFLAQFLSKNWAVFASDSLICSLGAIVFVAALAGSHKGTKKAVSMLGSGLRRSKKSEPSTPDDSQAEAS